MSRRDIGHGLLVALVVAVIHAGAITPLWLGADASRATLVPRDATLGSLFREPVTLGLRGDVKQYRPLAYATIGAERMVFADDARGPHATNVLLHAGTVAVLFLLLRVLGAAAPLAGAAALLFGVLPAHVDAVNVVVHRPDLLAGLGLMTGLLWLVAWEERRRVVAWGGAAALLLVALLCHENAAIALPISVLLLFLRVPASERRSRVFLPALALLVPLVVVFLVRRSVGAGVGTEATPPRELTALFALASRVSLWPPHVRTSYEDVVLKAGPGSSLLVMAVVAVSFGAARRRPLTAFAFAFLLLALLSRPDEVAPFAAHQLYVPLLALGILIASLHECAEKRWALPLFSALFLAGSAATIQRDLQWRSAETLWEAEAQRGPGDWRILGELAEVRLAQKRWNDVVEICDRAIPLAPAPGSLLVARGLALAELGRTPEAEAALMRGAIGGDPRGYPALARLFVRTGRIPNAVSVYRVAIAAARSDAERKALEAERARELPAATPAPPH